MIIVGGTCSLKIGDSLYSDSFGMFQTSILSIVLVKGYSKKFLLERSIQDYVILKLQYGLLILILAYFQQWKIWHIQEPTSYSSLSLLFSLMPPVEYLFNKYL